MSGGRMAFALLPAALLLAAGAAVPERQISGRPGLVLDTTVQRFDLSGETFRDGLAELSSQRIPLALGYEQVLNPKYSAPPIPAPRFDLHLQGNTVRGILEALCRMDPRYTWSQDGSTVNVYPVATIGDPTYLLNRKMAKFEMKYIARIDDALFEIPRQLPPPVEQVARLQFGGDDSYPAGPWGLTLENVTVRQVINRLAEHMGPRSVWVFYGARDFRAFFFSKYGFNPEPPKAAPASAPPGR